MDAFQETWSLVDVHGQGMRNLQDVPAPSVLGAERRFDAVGVVVNDEDWVYTRARSLRELPVSK